MQIPLCVILLKCKPLITLTAENSRISSKHFCKENYSGKNQNCSSSKLKNKYMLRGDLGLHKAHSNSVVQKIPTVAP